MKTGGYENDNTTYPAHCVAYGVFGVSGTAWGKELFKAYMGGEPDLWSYYPRPYQDFVRAVLAQFDHNKAVWSNHDWWHRTVNAIKEE